MGSFRTILRFILKLRTHTSRPGGRGMGDTLRECQPKPQRRRSIHQARSSTLEVRGAGRAQRRQTPQRGPYRRVQPPRLRFRQRIILFCALDWTPRTEKMATVKPCCENCRRIGCKKEFVFRPGEQGRSAQKRAECWSWREQFHAAELIRGGERSWISAAVSRSMTFIGPPHLGQR